MPFIETPRGSSFESNAILRYIARLCGEGVGLYGTSTYENSLVD